MPESEPKEDDWLWHPELGNCEIVSVDNDIEEVVVVVHSHKHLDETHTFDLDAVRSSWRERPNGYYHVTADMVYS